MNILNRLGNKAINQFLYIIRLFSMLLYTIRAPIKNRKYGREIIKSIIAKQIIFTAFDALKLIGTVSLVLGAIIIIQAFGALSGIGGDKLIGDLLVIVIIRELGPLLTAIIIIGRSGTAISTEIGNMVVNKEIEALYSMGIDPIYFIVFPRFVGMVVSMICLTIFFDVMGIVGGFLVANLQLTVRFSAFFNSVFMSLSVMDLVVGLVKAIGFGIIIVIVSVYHGLSVKISQTEVPMVTTKAVVSEITLSFIYNAIITAMVYI